jgi:uncharacterized protein YkwD/uncharacterized membrane protein required for colicin V production
MIGFITWLSRHWADPLTVLVLAWYAIDGWRRGFVVMAFEFVGFAVSLLAALLLYGPMGEAFASAFHIARPFAKPAGFFAIWILTEFAYGQMAKRLFKKIPEKARTSRYNRMLGIVPALFDGTLFLAVALSLCLTLPLPAAFKKDVIDSRVAGTLVRNAERLDGTMNAIFGGAAKETLTFLTVNQGSEESVELGFMTREYMPSADAEREMLVLVNAERAKAGIGPLTLEPAMVLVARAHSGDMLTRGYFSHVTPEGKTPTNRADAAEYAYHVYGENLAFSPNVSLAHTGLMNSPGHRANILSPEYHKIGIGIQDAGAYGLMVTQNFSD